MNRLAQAACVLLCTLCSLPAWAAPDEIQVYTEELNAPGQFGLEQHLNYSLKGEQLPVYPGQMTPHHVLQVTPEFSYGLSSALEAGLYVPLALRPDGNSYLNGLRLRLKYIAPRQDEDTLFYGLNAELGRDVPRTSESLSGFELRPIVGYRDQHWLFSFNPILNTGLASGVSHRPQFEPALKMAHSVSAAISGGLEYYGAYGELGRLLPRNQWGHTVYAVMDVETPSLGINFGLGRGNANTSDTWVLKSILSLSFE